MNILVVFTGGTIGSSTGDTVALDKSAPDRLLNEYRGGGCEFTAAHPLFTLSENMSFAKWTALLKFLKTTDLAEYDGVIITHGTDTLSYTAAFLGLALADTSVPIVITGSNHPLGERGSNAAENFSAAVALIKAGVQGVYVAYKSRSCAEYYHACDICEADGLTDCFSGKTCGRYDGETVILDGSMPRFTPPHTDFFTLDRSITLIRPYPNMSYDSISAEKSAAVLHLLYHSSTACTEGESLSLCGFAERCKAAGVPLYAAPFKRGAVPYSTTAELLAAGVKPLYGLTTECAYALLAIAYNQRNMTAEEYIEHTCS